MTSLQSPVTLQSLATPALVIDGAIAQRNILRLAEYAAAHELDIRPHTKTHKSRRIGALQVAAGATGLTVAKVGEAEVMVEVSDDILLAYPAVDPARTSRISRLALHRTVRVAIDSVEAAEALAEAARSCRATVGILVDIDVGLGRTGVQTPSEALRLAQFVDAAAGLRLDGIMCYPGHVTVPAADQEPALAAVDAILAETLNLWGGHGLQARIVSGGSTPTAYQSHLLEEISEIRPGTYVYNDMNTVRGGFCTLDQCAARIVSTVVSTAVPGQVVIDAGSKTLSSDRSSYNPDAGHGHVAEFPDARIVKLSEEHAQVDVRACKPAPKTGERVTVIPNHICPCVNLQDTFWWYEQGVLEPLPVDARGKLS